MRIADVAIEYEHLNRSPDEIINPHPHLKLEQVHDALSYNYENRTEIDRKIKQDKFSFCKAPVWSSVWLEHIGISTSIIGAYLQPNIQPMHSDL